MVILIPNNYPMREWHVKNMEKTVVKYLTGLPENASPYQKRLFKKYGGFNKVCNRIKYDIKHGVKNEEIVLFLEKIKTDSDFSDLRKLEGYPDRINDIETKFNDIHF